MSVHGLSPVRRSTILAAALTSAVAFASPAFAQSGGIGGGGVSGGASNATGTGANGNDGTGGIGQEGGGGGGAGVTGGNGGTNSVGAGSGLGATSAGGNGTAGSAGAAAELGGGGGGGGAHGAVVTTTAINITALNGGNGGNGGAGNLGSNAGGGGGGAGGYGAVVNGAITYTNTSTITGGTGGTGGTGSGANPAVPDAGGSGGAGGFGVAVAVPGATLTNSGTITGGNGGDGTGASTFGGNGEAGVTGSGLLIINNNSGAIAGGNGGTGSIGAGAGGAGITGSNLTITDSGSITAGTSGSGVQANAITFTGGTNSLTLQPGYSITGNVVAFSTADTFALGGSATTGFNLANFGAAGSSAQYQGFGVFQVTGGTWQLTGTDSVTAGWTVSGGNMQVGPSTSPGAVLPAMVTLTGGVLSGLGTVGGIVNTAGAVSPGVPGNIGALTVTGSYTQSTNSTLSIEVSPTAASKLAVGGAASLNGKLALVFDPGTYTPGSSYTLLTASSLTGTFSTVTGTNPSGLAQSILYEPDPSVVLQIGFGGTVAPTNDTIYSAATSIAVMNAQEINGIILDRIGARQGGIADGQIAALAPGGVPGTQLAQASGGNGAALGEVAAALPGALSSQGAWFRGIGGFASVNGSSTAPGFTGETGGFLAGYDRPVGQNIYLGVAGGYLHSNIDEHSTSSGTEGSARFNVYGGALVGPSLFSATAGYANDRFNTNRGLAGIGTANENHSGNEATAAGQWSLPLTIAGFGGGTATLTPKAGLEYLYLSEEAFSETGASGFDLSNSGHGTNSLQPYVGAALAQKFVTAGGTEIAPELRLGYAHEMFDSRLLTVTTVSGAAFPVEGVRPSRDQLTAGFGLVVQAAPNLSAYADYDTILHTGDTTEQVVQAGLRFKF